MAHQDSLIDPLQQKVRKADRKSKTPRKFNEETQDVRVHRINFKNYIRQVREQESALDLEEEWIVESGVDFDSEEGWVQVDAFGSQHEADAAVAELNEIEQYGAVYRARLV